MCNSMTGTVQRAELNRQWAEPNRQSAIGEHTAPESPHRTLHSLEAASCECLRLLEQSTAAVALGPAEPARAEGNSRSVPGQLQPFDQQGERLQDCLSPA